jgi:hypothetical protein
MAANDFLTCIFIPIKVVIETVDGECSIGEERMNARNSCIMRKKIGASFPMRFYSFAVWVLTFTPNFIAALMAICRFIQIKFPFFPLQLKHLIIPSVIFGFYTVSLSCYVAVRSNYMVDKQNLVGAFRVDGPLFLTILVYTWPCLLSQILSTMASLITIFHLCRVKRAPISGQSTGISKKSSLKILLTNFGGIVNNTAIAITMASQSKTEAASISQFFIMVLTPVLLSCFNPIVFILLTPKFKVSPMEASNSTRRSTVSTNL